MTTHFVEIRPAITRRVENMTSPWVALTVLPIAKQDAENLRALIGPHWEARVVLATQVDTTEITRLDLFAVFEGAGPGHLVRWRKVDVDHHPDCRDHSSTTWTMTASKVLTGQQWFRLQQLEARVEPTRNRALQIGVVASGLDPNVTSRERTVRLLGARDHRGHCNSCGAEALGVSVQVEIQSGCRSMVREYSL